MVLRIANDFQLFQAFPFRFVLLITLQKGFGGGKKPTKQCRFTLYREKEGKDKSKEISCTTSLFALRSLLPVPGAPSAECGASGFATLLCRGSICVKGGTYKPVSLQGLPSFFSVCIFLSCFC